MGALESKENGEQVSPLLDTKWTIVARQEQRRVVDAKMTSWVHNSNLQRPGQNDALFEELFRCAIRENRRTLLDSDFVHNAMRQTNCFTDSKSTRELGKQMARTATEAYRDVLGQIWDAYQRDGVLQRAQTISLMKDYGSVFRRRGRLFVASGLSLGLDLASRGLLLSAEEIQEELLRTLPRSVELVYKEMLRCIDDPQRHELVHKLLDPHGIGIIREDLQKGFMLAVQQALKPGGGLRAALERARPGSAATPTQSPSNS